MTNGGDLEYQWRAVFDTLLQCDAKGGVFPGAAEKFSFSKDSTTLTLKLRSGMKFQDGSAIDANAVKASVEYLGSQKAVQSSILKGVSVSAKDALNVVVTSDHPNSQLPSLFCGLQGILISPAALKSPSTLADKPVSSGPYVLDTSKSTSGSVYTFTRRSGYWDAAAYPHDSLVLKTLIDPSTRINALRTGEVDAALLAAPTVKQAESSGITVSQVPDLVWGLMLLDRTGSKVKAMGDVRVRKAINMVFDRAAMVKGIWNGQATPTTSLFSPATAAYTPESANAYPYDVTAAKKLMAEAGYADGFDIQLPTVANITDKAAPVIVQQLALLKIRVKEVPLSGPTVIATVLSGRFPLIYYSMLAQPQSDTLLYYGETTASWNPYHSTDPTFQALIDDAHKKQGSEANASYQAINKYLVDQAWFAPIAYTPTYFGIAKKGMLTTRTDRYGLSPNLRDYK